MIFAAAPTPDSFESPVQGLTRTAHVPPATVLISHADFIACIDTCVQALADESIEAIDSSVVLQTVATQLRAWLDGDAQILETGLAIDFDQFDAAVLSAEERLPQAGAHAQARLLRASRVLAEAVYAGAGTRG
jgi:hypothetical protein